MTLNELSVAVESFPLTPQFPVLFLGHGNPMNAIEENSFVASFRALGKELPHPKAVLCISAHWYIKGTKVCQVAHPETIHDFYGFPKPLFDVQYPAPGSPSLAKETQQLLAPLVQASLTDEWGLDHGAWSVLKHVFPHADVPVVQLSIDHSLPPEKHFEIGKQLKALRQRGILIVGSGNVVHNLGLVDFARINDEGYGFDWAVEARAKTNQWLMSGDIDALIQYQKQGRALQLAAPTPEHYLPLLYVLGAADKKECLTLFNDKLLAGSLSMTSVKIG
jgi:4,5-DOPA dioxygenase extradiol